MAKQAVGHYSFAAIFLSISKRKVTEKKTDKKQVEGTYCQEDVQEDLLDHSPQNKTSRETFWSKAKRMIVRDVEIGKH